VSVLLVDIGNTRVKWATWKGGRLGRGGALAHDRKPAGFESLVQRVKGVERVVAVSVAGARLDAALSRAARRHLGVAVEFIVSTRAAGGVVNGYREVWRLGADRWVAAIGAHALAKGRDVLFANVGTALTIDLVDARGRHRGGAIIPGPDTMVDSLLSGTQGIRRRARGLRPSARRLFAPDTASALAAGSVFAAAAFIDRAVAEAAAMLGRRPLVLVSGGGAPALRRHLRGAVRVVPDLVLRGLAELALERARGPATGA
jgi:type III pantothenate kinase